MPSREPRNRIAERRQGGPLRLGVFTRLVDEAAPADVYARALRLLETAEELGFDTAWVAQHHAHQSGGLPAPMVFLTAAAARTKHLRLGTGIITLPLEQPLRLAEDAAVLDILSEGRLELGFGTGGNEMVFTAFGRNVERRQDDYDRAFAIVRDALLGKPLVPGGPALFPPAERLATHLWEATFGVEGAIRAATHASGLLLSRTSPRTSPSGGAALPESQPLGDAQAPIVDAYLAHWTAADTTPRIGLSRSVYVAPTRDEALADAEDGIRRHARVVGRRAEFQGNLTVEQLLVRSDVNFGSPEDVIASLRADRLLSVATDLILQVHPVDPSPEKTLRSLQLIATEVAPALGWSAAHHERAPALLRSARR